MKNLLLATLLLITPAIAAAQHAQPGAPPHANAHKPAQKPFDFLVVGSFKHVNHTGDVSGKAALKDLPQGPGAWGVGALAGMKGEILLYDGRLLVSRGSDPDGRVRAPEDEDQAVLFSSGRVAGWTEVAIPKEMDIEALTAFVEAEAAKAGIEADTAFPFRVRGKFPALRWHVVTGTVAPHTGQPAGHAGSGHANKRSSMNSYDQPGAEGEIVGVYSGSALEGVVSHPGERLHLHYVDAGLTVSGHVDGMSVPAGAVLMLPR